MNSQERLETTHEVIQALMAHRDLGQFFDALSRVMKQMVPLIDEVGIARYDAPRQSFEVFLTKESNGGPSNRGIRTRDSEDMPGGYLRKTGRTTMINDLDAFESQSGLSWRAHFPRTFNSGIGALLEHGGQLLGYFYVCSSQKNVFTAEHRDFIDSVRGLVAIAFENALAVEALRRAEEQAKLEGEYLRSEIESSWPAHGLIGKSRLWKSVLHQINQVAGTDSTVLIHGETGTGKELIARAIHERSRRSSKPLIKVNCGALPENLVESELFGHERGSFTGAMGKRIGRFELADGGTIFLDEIGEMPLNLQVKLLRVLQEREFERVGGEKPIRVNVRVIAATNKDLSAEVAAGRFRADLFYRLNVFPVEMPALRHRPEDAVELARYFVSKLSERMGRRPMVLSDASLQAVQGYSWPGNVRELEHLVERAIILSSGNEVDLQSQILPGSAGATMMPVASPALVRLPLPTDVTDSGVSLKDSVLAAERAAIESALRESNGVVGGRNGAASRLGMKRQTLQSKMKKLGIGLGRTNRPVAFPPQQQA